MPGAAVGFSASNLFHHIPCDRPAKMKPKNLRLPSTAQMHHEALQWTYYLDLYTAGREPMLDVPMAVQVDGLARPRAGETPGKWWQRIVTECGDTPAPLRDESGKVIEWHLLGTDECDAPWQLVMLQEYGCSSLWPEFRVAPRFETSPASFHEPWTHGVRWKKELRALADCASVANVCDAGVTCDAASGARNVSPKN
jgi:hypothetical protein